MYILLINLPIKDIASTLIAISLTLLAINVAIFVLAVTFLGDAIELKKREKIKFEANEFVDFGNKMDSLRKKQDSLTPSSSSVEFTKIQKEMEKLVLEKKTSERSKWWLEYKFNSLNFVDSIAVPSVCFFLVIFICSVGLYLVRDINEKLDLLFLSFIFILLGIFKITLTLVMVETIALGSKERRQKESEEALLKSLIEHQERNKPKPVVNFTTPQPIQFKKESEISVEFTLKLSDEGGSFADNARIIFFVSPGIEFITESATTEIIQGPNFIIPNALSAIVDFGTINKGLRYKKHLKLKAGKAAGTYSLRYSVQSKQYSDQPADNPEIIIKITE